MKSLVIVFVFIFVALFMTMIVATSIVLAEEIATPTVTENIAVPTPRPTRTPVDPGSSMLDRPTETPDPEEMPQINDYIKDYEATIPMKAGEQRNLTIKIASSKDVAYEVIPTLTVSTINEEDIDSVFDDWAWCFDEWGIINVSPEKPYELSIELIPLEDVPAGTYEFNYELTSEETVKTIKIIVTIYTDS